VKLRSTWQVPVCRSHRFRREPDSPSEPTVPLNYHGHRSANSLGNLKPAKT
jgi:hypothetical protein